MIYADERFYKQNYLCGKKAVIDTAFDFYARNATQKIKQFTFDNVDEDNISECVKMCCCEVAELIYKYEDNCHNGITSEKVGDQSQNYENTEVLQVALSKSIKSAVYSWLTNTGLLFRGVY